MGKSVKIYDLAVNMIILSGLRFPDDIDIKITGLRPGEKIYEELLADGENTKPTYHEKIMIAKTKKINNAANKSSASDSIHKKNLRDRVFIVRLSKAIDFLTHGFRNLENQLC